MAGAEEQVGPGQGRWPYHLALLAGVALFVLLLFRIDVAHLVDIWWTSTTYGHCLFIGPVVGWLIWQRRVELSRLTPTAWWPGLFAVAGGGLLWLLGESATVALVRHLGLVAMLEGAVLTLLGPMVARGMLFPLAYAWFLVPFGAELERPLQQVTVSIVMPLLDWSGIPASADGVLIHAGRYWFEVAEACSGSKFVLAMVAFAALVANLCFRSPWRRAIFMVVSLIVPVLANGVRAWGRSSPPTRPRSRWRAGSTISSSDGCSSRSSWRRYSRSGGSSSTARPMTRPSTRHGCRPCRAAGSTR